MKFEQMKHVIVYITFCLPLYGLSQVVQDTLTSQPYFEDQFYIGITYNFLLDQPQGVGQRNFSYGLQTGFIKDIPVNPEGTFAFGIGLGLALNTYYSNIQAIETNDRIEYNIADSFRRSKLETHLVEAPFQLRWRNSTSTEYKFWRLYTGFKFGYAVGARSKFVSDNRPKISFNNTDVQDFHYGITLDFGYNSFNAHIYYALSNLFADDVTLNGNIIRMQPLQVGLMFYIL